MLLSVSLLLGGHALLVLTFCLLSSHLYLGQLSLNALTSEFHAVVNNFASLQGSEKSDLEISGVHGYIINSEQASPLFE